jgi:hypothetical protein
MNQRQLECAVARVTGESLREIRRLGFSLVSMPVLHDPRPVIQRLPRPYQGHGRRSFRKSSALAARAA